ncbi:hypothetical protein [Rhodopirellula sp. SWK7]|uniref:hypothetical protein n=1 Tax=Rhodopirellula sp. SWK7 TaxID=595460 RepID=UPI001360B0EB|nr:hypothetical protein [Rhodopirellula sp. SWK7]
MRKILRSVTILGEDHPSILRARGRGMRRCDHAIVCQFDRVWLVDLNPSRRTHLADAASANNECANVSAYELKADGLYYQIGDMRISIGPADAECPQSINRRRTLLDLQLTESPELPAYHAANELSSFTPPDSTNPRSLLNPEPDARLATDPDAVWEREPKAATGTMTPASESVAAQTANAGRKPAQGERLTLSRTKSIERRTELTHVADDPVLEGEMAIEGFDCPEMLTSHLTGRLVSIKKSRFTREKMLHSYAIALIFAFATSFLIWLAS